MQDALIQRLAEKDSQYYGQQISGTLTVAKSAAAGAIRDVKFLDTDTCFWQLTQQQTMQHKASSADIVPHLGDIMRLNPNDAFQSHCIELMLASRLPASKHVCTLTATVLHMH